MQVTYDGQHLRFLFLEDVLEWGGRLEAAPIEDIYLFGFADVQLKQMKQCLFQGSNVNSLH